MGREWSGLAPKASQSWSAQQQIRGPTCFLLKRVLSLLDIAEITFRANLKNSHLKGSCGLEKSFVTPGAWDLECLQFLVGVDSVTWQRPLRG